jgi:hypothetical protein
VTAPGDREREREVSSRRMALVLVDAGDVAGDGADHQAEADHRLTITTVRSTRRPSAAEA